MFLARTAAAYGAHVASRARVIGLPARGRAGHRRRGARPGDRPRRSTIRARQVINATGVWTDETQALVGERGQFKVRASQGHPPGRAARPDPVGDRADPAHREVGAVRHPVGPALDHRHHRHRLGAGQGAPGAPAPPTSTTCSSTSTRCSSTPLTRDDVEGVYAGLRPLLSGESESTSKLSREHAVAHPVPGLVVVAGGKYTTYRVMAKDAVDAAVHGLDAKVPRVGAPSEVPLLGAEGYAALWNRAARAGRGSPGCTWRASSTCCGRYGSLIDEVLDLVAADPTLGEPLAGRRGLPARRGRLRGLARGRPAPRRRADPAHPDLDRDLRPRASARCAGGRRADGAGARLERRAGRPRGRALPQAGRGRAGDPAACPTTRPPTRPGWARRRSSRSPDGP